MALLSPMAKASVCSGGEDNRVDSALQCGGVGVNSALQCGGIRACSGEAHVDWEPSLLDSPRGVESRL